MDLISYIDAWNVNQNAALVYNKLYPDRFHIIRYEDLVANSNEAIKEYCKNVGIDHKHSALSVPKWNSQDLTEVYPWGTIRNASPDSNKKTADELTPEEKHEISNRAHIYIEKFDYSLI